MNIVRWVKSHGHRRRTSFEAHDGGRWATLVFSGTPSERPSVSDELGETVDCHGVFDSGDFGLARFSCTCLTQTRFCHARGLISWKIWIPICHPSSRPLLCTLHDKE